MALVQVTPPSVEPVTVDEAKAHMRIDHADEDVFITSLITTARQYVEGFLQRSLLPQTWMMTLDAFPCGNTIVLPRPPLRNVLAVRYYDENGVLQDLPSSTYHVDIDSELGRVVLVDGAEWPPTQVRPNAVMVEFEAGYDDAASVPQPIKHAMLLLIAHWYENREAVTPEGSQAMVLPLAVDSLLRPYRVWRFG